MFGVVDGAIQRIGFFKFFVFHCLGLRQFGICQRSRCFANRPLEFRFLGTKSHLTETKGREGWENNEKRKNQKRGKTKRTREEREREGAERTRSVLISPMVFQKSTSAFSRGRRMPSSFSSTLGSLLLLLLMVVL
jgi:hypothetical protein